MKKFLNIFLCLSLLITGIQPSFAEDRLEEEVYQQEIEATDTQHKLRVSKNSRDGEVYVRISKKELNAIRKQAFISRGLLQRIRDLETLYRNIRDVVETIRATINFFKNFLNLEDLDIWQNHNEESKDFEHISGVIMSPGYVEFEVRTTNPSSNFDLENISELEVDVYYNKNLFMIDHLEGDDIVSERFRTISLSTKTAGAKDRLAIPLADLLINKTTFRLYLAPREPNKIKVGQSTKLDIRYYKQIPINKDGERIPPIEYSFTNDSAREIQVVNTR
jgi:predicted DNA binding CopG/RHH family protein